VSPVQAVREVLIATSGVTAIVSTRIYPGRAPDRALPPFIVLTGVSDEPQSTFEAETDETLVNTRVQIDCYDKQHDDAHDLAKLVRRALESYDAADGLRALKLDSRDLYDDDIQAHRVNMDFSIWNAAA